MSEKNEMGCVPAGTEINIGSVFGESFYANEGNTQDLIIRQEPPKVVTCVKGFFTQDETISRNARALFLHIIKMQPLREDIYEYLSSTHIDSSWIEPLEELEKKGYVIIKKSIVHIVPNKEVWYTCFR